MKFYKYMIRRLSRIQKDLPKLQKFLHKNVLLPMMKGPALIVAQLFYLFASNVDEHFILLVAMLFSLYVSFHIISTFLYNVIRSRNRELLGKNLKRIANKKQAIQNEKMYLENLVEMMYASEPVDQAYYDNIMTLPFPPELSPEERESKYQKLYAYYYDRDYYKSWLNGVKKTEFNCKYPQYMKK